jgi:hypothetical protein
MRTPLDDVYSAFLDADSGSPRSPSASFRLAQISLCRRVFLACGAFLLLDRPASASKDNRTNACGASYSQSSLNGRE